MNESRPPEGEGPHQRLVALMTILTAILVILAGLNVARLLRIRSVPGHQGLWIEINRQLAAREATGDFPAGLEELSLTFPDNGSPELLRLIDYARKGPGCRVATTLRGRKLEKLYGSMEEERAREPLEDDQ